MDDFAERLAAPTPTPGGGGAAAHVGVYACSLLRMVTGITLEKARSAKSQPAADPASLVELERIQEQARLLSQQFEALEAQDMAAFQGFLEALRLPRSTEEEKARRLEARREAAGRATDAPLATMRAACEVLTLARKLLDLSRSTPLKAESDLGAAVEIASAAFRVAELNVGANLPELAEERRQKAVEAWRELQGRARTLYESLRPAFAPAP